MKQKYILEKVTTVIFYLSAFLFFLIAFNFQDSKTSGWYQQFLPSPLGGQLKDIYFVDSLLGFAVSDSCILKTTNGGDNWIQKFSGYYLFKKIKFIDINTGYACAGNNKLLKSTNSGENWTIIILPMDLYPIDMAVINQDTIWLVDNGGLTGGAFLTINGGINWQVKYTQTSANPSHIYMFNARIGFIDGFYIRKTTDGGNSWFPVTTSEGHTYLDMYFIDSLTGWKANGFMKKTTNGGVNWINQPLPQGGYIYPSQLNRFSLITKDTIWGVGSTISIINNQFRGILFFTSNGGNNWYYQLPDTSINIAQYKFIKFVNKRKGWAYSTLSGIHTTVGGDTTFVMSVKQINSNISSKYKLEQNYPNPFNSMTNVKFQMLNSGFAELKVFDISGRLIKSIVNQNLKIGEHSYKFNGGNLSSGIYFYSLFVDGGKSFTAVKKMVLIK